MRILIALLLSKHVVLGNKVVVGNASLPSNLILKTAEQGYEKVLDLYKAYGFLQATIKVKNDTIIVDEGPQFKIGDIIISGNQIFNDSELLSLFRRGVFNELELIKDINRVIRKYENSGYPYCTAKIDSLELETNSMNIWLQIIEGPLIQISDIKVNGNKITKDYVILRELRIKRGDIFYEDKIHEATQRLNRLEFIELVETNLVNQDELHIHIKERPANRIDGAFGYRRPGFIGMIELKLLNLIGTGRCVSSKWQKIDTTSTFFELKYKEPWVFRYPMSFTGIFSYLVEPLYVKRRAELLFDVPVTTTLAISTGMSGTWIGYFNYNSGMKSLPPRYRGMLGVSFCTRSIPGVDYRAKSEWNIHKLEEVMLNLDNYLSWSKITTIALVLGINFGAILREEVGIYDQLKLGGTHTLRGYWEEEFRGIKVWWINMEIRKYIGGESFIFPFYDIGNIDGNVAQSFGFGIAASSPIGIIKIVSGWPKGVGVMEGKLHISIKSTF